jgi:hypothetical protein
MGFGDWKFIFSNIYYRSNWRMKSLGCDLQARRSPLLWSCGDLYFGLTKMLIAIDSNLLYRLYGNRKFEDKSSAI